MVIIIPGVYSRTLPDEKNLNAVIGILAAISLRLLLIIWYLLLIKKIRADTDKRKIGYILIGIFLIIFGLVYTDGAIAFFDHKNVLYISYLMFTSVLCDFIASILTFRSIFLKSKNINEAQSS